MTGKNRTLNPSIILFLVPVIWGINFTVMKIGMQSLTPVPYNTSRLLVAVLISWLLVFGLKAYSKVKPWDWPAIITVSLGFALSQIGIAIGVNLTTAANSALIMALIPLSVLAINLFLGRETINRIITIGIFLSFLGVALVILGTGTGFNISKSDLTGVIIIFGAQFCAAYFTVFSKPLLEKYSSPQIIAYAMTISALVFIALSFKSLLHTNWLLLPASAWFSILYSGILALAVGNVIWLWAVKKIGSTRTAVFSNETPLFAILTGCLILKEPFGIMQVIGAIIILSGIIITQKARL